MCKNAKGETVGSVKKDDQGHTLVYDSKGTVIGRSSVTKGSNPKTYEVNVGQTAGTAKVWLERKKNTDPVFVSKFDACSECTRR